MRRVLTSAALLAIAASVVTASTGTASTAADPGARTPGPAGGPAAASEPGPVRYHRGAPASAYVPTTPSGRRLAGDAHETRWTLAGPQYSGAWTWQRFGNSGSDAGDGLLIDPALAAPAGAVWFWRAPLRIDRGHRGCVRVLDASIQRVVADSEMCLELPESWPTPTQTWIYDSPPLVLNPGEHVYVVQGLQTQGARDADVGQPFVVRAELVARWVGAGVPTQGR
jgi:hypothetical protein